MNTGRTPREPDRKARFDQHVMPVAGQLYPAAMRLTRNRSDAEDLVQDTLERAFTSIDQLREDTRAKPWLMRILHNTFISRYRQQSREARPEPVKAYEEWYSSLNQMTPPPRSAEAEYMAQMPAGGELKRALRRLPELTRRILYMADVEGYDYDAIAQATGLAEGTVKSRVHRARARLRERLTAYGSDAMSSFGPPGAATGVTSRSTQ